MLVPVLQLELVNCACADEIRVFTVVVDQHKAAPASNTEPPPLNIPNPCTKSDKRITKISKSYVITSTSRKSIAVRVALGMEFKLVSLRFSVKHEMVVD